MSILNDINLVSGLKINIEKTKAIQFGVPEASTMTICEDLELIWKQEFPSLGINYSINELNKITYLNLDSNILEIENGKFCLEK